MLNLITMNFDTFQAKMTKLYLRSFRNTVVITLFRQQAMYHVRCSTIIIVYAPITFRVKRIAVSDGPPGNYHPTLKLWSILVSLSSAMWFSVMQH